MTEWVSLKKEVYLNKNVLCKDGQHQCINIDKSETVIYTGKNLHFTGQLLIICLSRNQKFNLAKKTIIKQKKIN
jgi:hypothetical protein